MFSAEDFTVQNSEFLIRRGWRMWSRSDLFEGKMLLLCPVDDFKNIPKGTRMTHICGGHAVKGKDKITMDHKGGVLAYGILLEDIIVPDENKKYRSIDDFSEPG
jgi:hypothetical protein